MYMLKNFHLMVCWVPGHARIAENETADQIAAGGALADTVDIISYTDLKPHIRQYLCETWQADWGTQRDKLNIMRPYLRRYTTDPHNRFIETGLARLQMGHTHATHSPLTIGSPRFLCSRCGRAYPQFTF